MHIIGSTAAMAVEVDAGEPWWLTADEEAALAEWNQRHVVVSAIEEQLADRVEATESAPALTPSEVLKKLGYQQPTNPQARECGAVLRRRFGPPKRIRGADRWRVDVKEPPTDWVCTDPATAAKARAAEKAAKGMEKEVY